MQYDLNQLSDPKRFQSLVNAILTARFGEDARLTPIRGADGGSDGETAVANPYLEFRYEASSRHSNNPLIQAPRPGRYLFQVKYHPTGEQRLADLRSIVTKEFRDTLTEEVLNRLDRNDVNYFFLVTNIKASKDSIQKIDEIRLELLNGKHHLHADVWWGERITAALDWAPQLWLAYPEIFPGRVPPLVGLASTEQSEGAARTLRMAVAEQYIRDSQVKFRQIELEKRLLDLFVDLDIGRVFETDEISSVSLSRLFSPPNGDPISGNGGSLPGHGFQGSVLNLLLDDNIAMPKILLEGGPGQGKSTITQMAAQVYREKIIDKRESESRDPTWHRVCQLRVPIRLELRDLAHWISENSNGTLEQYIAFTLAKESGGAATGAEDVHRLFDHSSIILFLDGLDEIGNDTLRDHVLDAALAAIERFETGLKADVRVVLTTRPPAITGRWGKLKGFIRVVLAPMEADRIDDYLGRWLEAQIPTGGDRHRIRNSFQSRRKEPHVEALARNPMQLSVLLQFIYLKGEAFPDRRAELYREYFQIVIDRDVEKSPDLREHREVVEGLHSYLGFLLHGYAEAEKGRRALNRSEMLDLAGKWLEGEGYSRTLADKYFALGEERFGLIVALSGEGQETTYGFEIQPIQEYFAAAYISNRLANGRAHEVFQTLINKDYWREVALFLAGLRRPNEKADLVARAKEADREAPYLGQQNGRAIVLQLLREGVLSQPRHVQTEAMRYAFGFLDATTLRLQRNPHEIIDLLAELARGNRSDETNAKIVEVVRDVRQSADLILVSLLYRMAGKALPKEQYKRLVLEYSGLLPETRGLVRISCPLDVSGVIEELGSDLMYWEGIPVHVVARNLWFSATRAGVVPNIVYPPGTHFGMILQFAVGQSNIGRRRRESVITIQGDSVPAIWKLYQNVQLIRTWLMDNDEGSKYYNEKLGESRAKDLLWTDGRREPLPEDVERCMKKLIGSSDAIIAALRARRRGETNDGLSFYLQTIRECLSESGIAAWIAVHCASELFRGLALARVDLGASGLSEEVLKELLEFFPKQQYPRRRYLVERFGIGTPLAVRMEPGSELRPLHELAGDFILRRMKTKERKRFKWLEEVPLPTVMMRPLIDLCRGEMEAVLRFIGSRATPTGPRYYGERRLRVQDTRRILMIARDTQEREVLQGAAALLINAKFARIAEPGLIEKILAASPEIPLVARVFDTHYTIRGRDEEPELRELARELASKILNQAKDHPFRVVNRAAAFMAEVEAQRNTPLFQENPELETPNQI